MLCGPIGGTLDLTIVYSCALTVPLGLVSFCYFILDVAFIRALPLTVLGGEVPLV